MNTDYDICLEMEETSSLLTCWCDPGTATASAHLSEESLAAEALAPSSPKASLGVLASDAYVPSTRNPKCTLKVMIFHWKMINTEIGRDIT